MKLLIGKNTLKLILSQHKDQIGFGRGEGIDTIIAAIAFIVTVMCADFNTIAKASLVTSGTLYLGLGVYRLWRSRKNKKFDYNVLYKEIMRYNMLKKHRHSIVLIKDTFNKNANRYLVYYDERWGCRLFLNYHTSKKKIKDDDYHNIIRLLKMELKVSKCTGALLAEEIQAKYSYSAKKEKVYLHKYYKFEVSGNSELKKDVFTIEGKNYYWMSIAEMEADQLIMERNREIVSFVKSIS